MASRVIWICDSCHQEFPTNEKLQVEVKSPPAWAADSDWKTCEVCSVACAKAWLDGLFVEIRL